MCDSRVLIKTNDGEYRVARDDLEKVEYFRIMLRENPPHLILPFPNDIVKHILGIVQHGHKWVIPYDPNVRLGLEYCQLIRVSPEAEDEPFPPFLREELMKMNTYDFFDALVGRIQFAGTPLVIETKSIKDRDFPGPHQYKLICIILEGYGDMQITIMQGGEVISSVNIQTYSSVFNIYNRRLYFKPTHLLLVNSPDVTKRISLHFDDKATIVTIQDNLA